LAESARPGGAADMEDVERMAREVEP
jgi:hypothetical protein